MSAGRAYRRQLDRRALYIGPSLNDDLDTDTKEGVIRRRLTVMQGHCPCGARAPRPGRERPGTVTVYKVTHEPGCPAGGAGVDLILLP